VVAAYRSLAERYRALPDYTDPLFRFLTRP
jgi:hypothetical protein